jgi:maltooligosyltrehalose trehalohydrolase
VLIAESDLNDPRVITPRQSGGWGIHAQWNDDFHHALFALLTGDRHGYYGDFGSLAQLAHAITSAYVYDGVYSRCRGRTHGRAANHLPAHSFLGCIQNHDQVGNRAFGDRLHRIAGAAKAKLAAAIVLTAPFIPLLFQGEEFAAGTPFLYFADHEAPELARAVSEGRRREHATDADWHLLPDPESPETFHRSQLNWDELDDPSHAAFLDWYARLIALRRAHAGLRDADLSRTRVRFDESAQWLAIERGAIRVLCNFSTQANRIPLHGCATPLLVSNHAVQFDSASVTLPPESVAVVTMK